MGVAKAHRIHPFPIAAFVVASFTKSEACRIFDVLGPLGRRVGKGEVIAPKRNISLDITIAPGVFGMRPGARVPRHGGFAGRLSGRNR